MIYCDPPYPLDTRTGGKEYTHEMTNEQHEQLVDTLLEVPGYKIVSTYEHEIYNRLLTHGWTQIKRDVLCSVSRVLAKKRGQTSEDFRRTECLYCSPGQKKLLF